MMKLVFLLLRKPFPSWLFQLDVRFHEVRQGLPLQSGFLVSRGQHVLVGLGFCIRKNHWILVILLNPSLATCWWPGCQKTSMAGALAWLGALDRVTKATTFPEISYFLLRMFDETEGYAEILYQMRCCWLQPQMSVERPLERPLEWPVHPWCLMVTLW